MIGKIVSGLVFGVVAAVASASFDDKLSFPYIVAGVTVGMMMHDIRWKEYWFIWAASFLMGFIIFAVALAFTGVPV